MELRKGFQPKSPGHKATSMGISRDSRDRHWGKQALGRHG